MCVDSGDGADEFGSLLAKIEPDTRAFRTDLLAEHRLAVRVGGAALTAVAATFAVAALSALKALLGLAH